MFVSVILPTLNEENFVHLALESLNDQTVPFELIVIDGGSTDRTVEIAKSYTPLVFTAPKGKLNAKNLGVLEASGDIIVMADADVYYSTDFLERITRHFNDLNVVMVGGLIYEMDEIPHSKLTSKIVSVIGFFFLKYLRAPVTAYRRSVLIEAGGYNLNIDQSNFMSVVWEEEIRMNWKIMRFGRVVYDPSAVAFHFNRRSLCSIFGDACPINYEAVCAYCEEITGGKRF